MPEPLRVEIRPSLYLRIALCLLGLFAAAAITQTALSLSVRVALTVLAIGYTVWLLRRHTALCSALIWNGSVWLWIEVDGAEHGVVLEQATVWPVLLVLNFRDSGTRKRRVLVLLPDSAAADALRRLRVYLSHLPVFDA